MRLTRRGKAVVGVCVAGFALAALSGARSLNAVVLPGLVALVAGAVQLTFLPRPTVSRRVPATGFVGETVEVTLAFDGVERPFVGTVSDAVGEGLSASGATVRAAVGSEPVTYEATYEARGERAFGPVRLAARDVLGLFEADLTCPGTDRVLVYPAVSPVADWLLRDLYADRDVVERTERTEFDRLREYVRGDALRDIHWKTTARRDELTSREFTATAEAESVTVAASSAPDRADEMAEAAASVALALLDADVPVTLSLPEGRTAVEPGRGGRTTILERCAYTAGGSAAAADAEVEIRAERGATRITVGDRTTSFERVRGGRSALRDRRSTDGGAPEVVA
ncbi:DUF58 domain-containing protein [Halegenticoccus tardaugens]|uniref:DUF58 domain-containing protein n=1 Tax=Halegenticoccus tardaugens TaxID=2071624 RepID=UPI00100AAEFF|nr:DUF58 domain-containing protein [Halegenticoccus tardaugens]